MIYQKFVGHPSPKMPENVVLLGEIIKHFQGGTEWSYVYADSPVSKEDREEFDRLKEQEKVVNKREWPCWV